MHSTTLVVVALLVVIVCVQFGQALQCYSHDYCIGCPTLSATIQECTSKDSKCWKFTTPLGTKRGCADDRCMIQIDTGFVGTANLCCSGNLCNSAHSIKTTMVVIMASLIAGVYAWYLN